MGAFSLCVNLLFKEQAKNTGAVTQRDKEDRFQTHIISVLAFTNGSSGTHWTHTHTHTITKPPAGTTETCRLNITASVSLQLKQMGLALSTVFRPRCSCLQSHDTNLHWQPVAVNYSELNILKSSSINHCYHHHHHDKHKQYHL